MAAPSVRGTTGYTSSAGGITIAQPVGTSVGDYLVATITSNGSTVTTPSGWTLIRSDANAATRNTIFGKFATVAGTSPSTGFSPATGGCSGDIIALTGTNTTSPVQVNAGVAPTSPATTIAAPDVTSTTTDTLLLACFGYSNGSGTNDNPSIAGMTRVTGFSNASASPYLGFFDFSEVRSVAGATGTRSIGFPTSYYAVGQSLLIAPVNVAPNAPTLNNPVGNASVDRSVSQRFSWTFSDPNTGDAQSKFDLQYRVVSTSPWTTVTGVTPNQFYDFAGGTFAAGSYEWQVRTYDSLGLVGPFSASAFFTAATAPAGPTITAPTTGATVSTSSGSITWSYPAQSAYRVRKVADNAGVPDTATIYYDSGEIADATSRSAALTFPVNGRYEHLQVLIRDSGSALLSPYSSVRVQVSYTPPATPTLVVTPNNSTGSINVAVTNPTPTGSQPVVNSWDIYRRVAGDGTAGVRIAASIATTYTDRTPASGVAYEYLVRANGTNSTTANSAWTA